MRVIGRAFNHDVIENVKELKTAQEEYRIETDKKIKDLENSQREFEYYYKECEAKNARRRILRAADELRTGVEHSHEYFTDILADISFYENFCENNKNFKNMQAVAAIAFVTEVYQHCLKENKFL